MIYAIYVGATAALVAFGFVVAWSRRNRVLRWALILVALLVIPASYFGALDMLSRPKPKDKEYLLYHTQKAEVKGFHAIAGEGLYLLLFADQWPEPRYFKYPWNEQTKKMIKQLQDAQEGARKHGVPLFMYNPFEPSLENESPIFDHPLPPPRLPPKDLFKKQEKPKRYKSA